MSSFSVCLFWQGVPFDQGPFNVLGHSTQSQHIEANVAHADWFVQVKFDDRDLLDGALVAKQAATVAANGNRVRKIGRWIKILGYLKRVDELHIRSHTSDVSSWWLQTWLYIHSSLSRHTMEVLLTAYLYHAKPKHTWKHAFG